MGVDQVTKAAVGFSFVGTVVSLGLLLPTLAVSVRRLHDSDLPGWWLLMPIGAAIAGLGLLIGGVVAVLADVFFPGVHHGFGLAIALTLAGGLLLLASLVIGLVLMLRPSTAGPNRFGPGTGVPYQYPPMGGYGYGPGYAPTPWTPTSPSVGNQPPAPSGPPDQVTGPAPGHQRSR